MKFIGNILWFAFGGWFLALCWTLLGILWCITIIGIPVGVQCFKFASLSLFPFGKDVLPSANPASLLINILWIIFGGLEMALANAAVGIVYCITIIGMPFGIQCFKMAKLALMPIGAKIISTGR